MKLNLTIMALATAAICGCVGPEPPPKKVEPAVEVGLLTDLIGQRVSRVVDDRSKLILHFDDGTALEVSCYKYALRKKVWPPTGTKAEG